jgi:hypothetical protein
MLCPILVAGCGIAALQQRNDSITAMNEQARQTMLGAQANAHQTVYVVAERAWLCLDEIGARAQTACTGGTELQRGATAMIVGQGAKDGVWPVAIFDAKGEHRMFIAAVAVNELPDLKQQDAYADDVKQRFPAAKQIPLRDITFANLIEQPDAFRDRLLVVRQPLAGISNEDYRAATGMYTFTIPIPVSTGSKWNALAQFELKSKLLVDEFTKGHRAYSCGGKYCDDFVIVAELTGRTVERIDEFGGMHRLPVFVVHEMGDRYATYREDR